MALSNSLSNSLICLLMPNMHLLKMKSIYFDSFAEIKEATKIFKIMFLPSKI